jgi:hypothetical protein
MHGAEGQMYREALMHAGQACGLDVTGVPDRDLFEHAAAVLGLPVWDLRSQVAALGRNCGPPWGHDQKAAAVAAWIALTMSLGRPPNRAGSRARP